MIARVLTGGPPWRTVRARVHAGRRRRISIVFTDDGNHPVACVTLSRQRAIELTNAIADALEGN